MSNQNNIHVVSRAVIIDNDRILVCKTLDLDPPFYFLPGGHVECGESAQTALLRELMEEIGLKCSVKRFLGCLEYCFEPGHSSICHNHEYNLIFEVTAPELQKNKTVSSREGHIQIQWITLDRLKDIDFRAEPLVELLPKWIGSPQVESFVSAIN